MKKYISLLIIFVLTLSACVKQLENIPDTPLPEPIIPVVDEIDNDDASIIVIEEPAPLIQEVPQYNDYHVSLEIDPTTRTITGIERIRYTNHTGITLNNIVLRTFLNAFDDTADILPYFPGFESRIFTHGKSYGHINILHVSMDKDELAYDMYDTVLNIVLNHPLEPEETVQLLLQFEAYIPKIAHRTGANDQAMWMGMFLPVLSVHNGHDWEMSPYYPAGDPFLLETAHFTVLVTTPPEYTVAGGGHKKEDLMEDKKITTFNTRMVRDFSFSVSPFYNIAETITETGVNIHFYYYTNGLRVDDILKIAKESMEYFEEKVGKYPYGHVSIVETDLFVNGMEFSKIVFMNSDYLQKSRNYASLVHELGHQWFYNIVGNNPITEAWLDEGLTLYMQEAFFHEDRDSFHEKMMRDYANLKKRNGSYVLASDLSQFDNWRDYYTTHYTKAKLMLYALNLRMGDEAFDQFINQYYQSNSFRIAKVADFIAIAEEVHEERLQDFFAEWLFGSHLPELE